MVHGDIALWEWFSFIGPVEEAVQDPETESDARSKEPNDRAVVSIMINKEVLP
jgi:hypothetical protein